MMESRRLSLVPASRVMARFCSPSAREMLRVFVPT
jgi:hypothetical protein